MVLPVPPLPVITCKRARRQSAVQLCLSGSGSGVAGLAAREAVVVIVAA